MTGTAWALQSSSGSSGGDAVSHVYIKYPPLRCNIPGSRGLYYDDGNKLLLSVTSDQVFSWKIAPYDPRVAPTADRISEGPILSIRYSLDTKFIAIQRSSREIQFWHRETGDTFSQKCRSESESILGFFWTDYPHCHVVFVKTSGLDMFAFNSDSKSLRLVEAKKLNVSWYVYTHESRLVLLASGMQCKTFTGFQVSSAGIIRLPRFDMAMAKSEDNSKPVLAAEDVYIITVYGRIYCLQFDRVAMQLHSYRFYRDAVVQQGSLPIYSSKIAVSVVDHVLLVHQVDAKVVILYDLFYDSRAPISAPLPLLLRGQPRSYTSALRSNTMSSERSEVTDTGSHETVIYGDHWNFPVPDLILDLANGVLWQIHLDLEAISASSSEAPLILEFLQRRKLEASKAKHLSLAIMRAIILERRPVSMVSRAIDVLVTSYSQSLKTGGLKGIKAEKSSSSGPSHGSGHRSSGEIHTSRVNAFNQAITHESAAQMETESIERSSVLSASDSEEKINPTAERKMVRESLVGAEGSSADIHPSSSESQPLGPSNNFFNVNAAEQLETQLTFNAAEQLETQLTLPAVSPDETYAFVFASVEEEMVGDPSYMVAVIVEYLRSASQEKVKVHPNLYVLTVQMLARAEHYAELGLFIINKILEPSREVAFQLLESGRQNLQTRKLGLDMLRQLSLHHDYVSLLVQDGHYLEALRYAQKYQVTTVRPSLFLEAAFASHDSQHIAAILRFFSELIPGFKSTSDYNTYFRILNETNSFAAARYEM